MRPTSGGDSTALRRGNTVTTLKALREQPAGTLTELHKRTGLSRPTVETAVNDLLEAGWAVEIAPDGEDRPVGRPARRFRFRGAAGYALGIDIGAHKALAVLTDLDGEPVGEFRAATDPDDDQAARLAAVRYAARRCLADAGVPDTLLCAVGVASPGVVDRTGRIVYSPLPDWIGLELSAELSGDFPCPVLAENDCNLAALAERWLGAGRGSENLVYILSGLRTGAGLILGGRLHRGHVGAAGETGALPQLGWAHTQDHLLNFAGLPDGLPQELRAEHVITLARGGDHAALAALRAYTADLATGIAAIVLTVDPETVVLGGGLWRSADLLLEPLREHLEPLCLVMPRLEVSSLGVRSVALGAVRIALSHLDERLYDVATPLPGPLG